MTRLEFLKLELDHHIRRHEYLKLLPRLDNAEVEIEIVPVADNNAVPVRIRVLDGRLWTKNGDGEWTQRATDIGALKFVGPVHAGIVRLRRSEGPTPSPPTTPATPAASATAAAVVPPTTIIDARATVLAFPRTVSPKFPPPGYYATDHWRNLRSRALRQADNCGLCEHHEGPLELHHVSYKNLGHEELGRDVILLCDECHARFHHRLLPFGRKAA